MIKFEYTHVTVKVGDVWQQTHQHGVIPITRVNRIENIKRRK